MRDAVASRFEQRFDPGEVVRSHVEMHLHNVSHHPLGVEVWLIPFPRDDVVIPLGGLLCCIRKFEVAWLIFHSPNAHRFAEGTGISVLGYCGQCLEPGDGPVSELSSVQFDERLVPGRLQMPLQQLIETYRVS